MSYNELTNAGNVKWSPAEGGGIRLDLLTPGGTFTPTLGATSSDPTVTYGTRHGVWARGGPLVFLYVRIDWTAISGGEGDVRILGLDAAPRPDTSFVQILPGRALGVSFGSGRSAIYASFPSPDRLQVAAYGSAIGTLTISMTQLGSNGSLLFQGTYLTTDPLP